MGPIPHFGKPDDATLVDVDAALLGVLRSTQFLPSVACRESALHGLGHWRIQYPERVEAIINEFIDSGYVISPELREYAVKARFRGVL